MGSCKGLCEKSRGSADVVRMPGMGFVHPRESSALEQKLQTLQSTKTNCSEAVLHSSVQWRKHRMIPIIRCALSDTISFSLKLEESLFQRSKVIKLNLR